MEKNRNELKKSFKTGAKPTEQDFIDLIDSLGLKSELVLNQLATLEQTIQGVDNNNYITPYLLSEWCKMKLFGGVGEDANTLKKIDDKKADKTAVDLQINDLGVQIEAAKNGLT
ncbi:MAG: hypothetical protein K2Q03_05680, partial [Sphingobacteriaceae bacterium]|nr:hypothetical protein [Sphingobacteriaceae bacterium]